MTQIPIPCNTLTSEEVKLLAEHSPGATITVDPVMMAKSIDQWLKITTSQLERSKAHLKELAKLDARIDELKNYNQMLQVEIGTANMINHKQRRTITALRGQLTKAKNQH